MSRRDHADRLLRHPAFARSSIAESFRASPLGLVDVGARGSVDPVLTQLAGATSVLGFEPDEAEARRLRGGASPIWAAFDIEPAALAERAGEARLYLAAEPNNHSLRRPNAAFTRRYAMEKFREVGSESLRAEALDAVIFGRRPPGIRHGELLKIDTQGTELEILRGAERVLAERTAAIVCEVEFAPIYEGQALFADVERWLRERGFCFFGFSEQHGRSRKSIDKRVGGGRERLLWSDAIFFRDPLAAAVVPEGNLRLADCLIVASVMLGFYDYALEVAEWSAPARADGSACLDAVGQVARDFAALDPQAARDAARALAAATEADPERANILVGQFVDRRRKLHDYDDVRLDSPWRAGAQTLGWEPPEG